MILNIFTVICVLTFISPRILAQELDVAYVESPPEVVELMMDISDISAGDYVIDLGTGDGRILIAAAKRGALGHGVDLDPQRITEARENAAQEGVSDRIAFIQEDLFDSDLSQASVITMYLNSEVNLRLRPALLSLQPGTRIVSHNFDMGDWKPDRYQQTLSNNNGNFLFHDVYYWVVPAYASGTWQWSSENQTYELSVQQEYQVITVKLNLDDRSLDVTSSYLTGKLIQINANNPATGINYVLSGTIEDGGIIGDIQIEESGKQTIVTWSVTK